MPSAISVYLFICGVSQLTVSDACPFVYYIPSVALSSVISGRPPPRGDAGGGGGCVLRGRALNNFSAIKEEIKFDQKN